MTSMLTSLIQQARTELGSTACQAGRHTWGFEGGRSCPHDLTDNCSQAVYACIVCGAHDHGETGGPGEQDCARNCQHKTERARARLLSRTDPLAWAGFVNRTTLSYHQVVLRNLRRQPKARLP